MKLKKLILATVAYQYDPLGRRYGKTVSGTSTQYLSDGATEIAEYASESGGSTLLRRYVYGPGIDEPIVKIEYSGGSESSRHY